LQLLFTLKPCDQKNRSSSTSGVARQAGLLPEAARAEGAGEDQGGAVGMLQPVRFQVPVQTLSAFEEPAKEVEIQGRFLRV
jgi:hypothetical protein